MGVLLRSGLGERRRVNDPRRAARLSRPTGECLRKGRAGAGKGEIGAVGGVVAGW